MASFDVIAAEAKAQSSALGSEATAYLNEVKEFVKRTVDLPDLAINIEPIDPSLGENIRAIAGAQPPSEFDLFNGDPSLPSAPSLGLITVEEFGNVPVLTLAMPTLTIPTAPNAALPANPGNAPDFHSPVIPNSPTFTLPTPPVFSAIELPEVPTYSIPTYTPLYPVDDMITPSNTFSFNEATYQSTLLDATKAKILNDILNGGYGIDTNDEDRLWERGREREMLAAETRIQQVNAQTAARGFPLPPGAMLALAEGAMTESLEKISTMNRDIAIKRADMYVENRKFTIEQAREVESMLITYYGYRMERALNVAKYTMDFSINVFNAQVQRYNARLEATRVAAQLYETQLKAALAGLEAYKTKVEGARLAAEVQRLYADTYRTQLEGVKALVEIYQTQMEAAKVSADIERLKLDAFRTRVDAYSAQVGAKTAEFNMFKAQIDGESAKMELYGKGVAAYQAEVSAYGTKVQASKSKADVSVAAAGLVLEQYKAQLEAYTAQLRKVEVEIQARLTKYNGDLSRYKALVDAEATAINATTDAMKANAQLSISKAQVSSAHITNTAQIEQTASSAEAHLSANMYGYLRQQIAAIQQTAAGIYAEIK